MTFRITVDEPPIYFGAAHGACIETDSEHHPLESKGQFGSLSNLQPGAPRSIAGVTLTPAEQRAFLELRAYGKPLPRDKDGDAVYPEGRNQLERNLSQMVLSPQFQAMAKEVQRDQLSMMMRQLRGTYSHGKRPSGTIALLMRSGADGKGGGDLQARIRRQYRRDELRRRGQLNQPVE